MSASLGKATDVLLIETDSLPAPTCPICLVEIVLGIALDLLIPNLKQIRLLEQKYCGTVSRASIPFWRYESVYFASILAFVIQFKVLLLASFFVRFPILQTKLTVLSNIGMMWPGFVKLTPFWTIASHISPVVKTIILGAHKVVMQLGTYPAKIESDGPCHIDLNVASFCWIGQSECHQQRFAALLLITSPRPLNWVAAVKATVISLLALP